MWNRLFSTICTPETGQYRLHSLDGFRGISAYLIVFYHMPELFWPSWNMTVLCVDLFFVISGYIIARHYEDALATGDVSVIRFLAIRLARLYPMYVLGTALMLVTNSSLIYSSGFYHMLAMQLTMLQYFGTEIRAWNEPVWSVSVEWGVNIVFCIVAFMTGRIRAVFLWVLLSVSVSYLFRLSPFDLNIYQSLPGVWNATTVRGLSGFVTGLLIFRHQPRLPAVPAWLLYVFELAIAAGIVWAGYTWEQAQTYGLHLIMLALMPGLVMVSLYQNSLFRRITSFWLIQAMGKISYCVYTLHRPFKFMCDEFIFPYVQGVHPGLLYLILLTGLSVLICRWIEQPCRVFGKRLAYKYIM